MAFTDGVEALQREGDAQVILSISGAAARVLVMSRLSLWREGRRAVDQPETLRAVQQHHTSAHQKKCNKKRSETYSLVRSIRYVEPHQTKCLEFSLE